MAFLQKRCYSETEIFETLPVPRAVGALVVPTILSQLVTMVYNLADTFFIGQLNNPTYVAAVSLSFALYNLLSALANLFGMGGGSDISRLLGAKRDDEARYVSAFSFYIGLLCALVYSVGLALLSGPVLRALGASAAALPYAQSYLRLVIGIGGVPTMLGLMLAHLLRSEGHARDASFGMMLGGFLNLALDPLFLFVFEMNVAGVALATLLSNCVSCLYLLNRFLKQKNTHMSLNPRDIRFSCAKEVLLVGLPAAMGPLLASVANMTMNKLISPYGDIPLAAVGVVQKLDMMPLQIGMGLYQGFMPLVGYSFAAQNYGRMKAVAAYTRKLGVVIAACFVAVYLLIPHQLVTLFIHEPETVALGSVFLRLACLAVPFAVVNFLTSYTLQAMGRGTEALFLASSRRGLIHIPLMLLLNALAGMYGVMVSQTVAEILTVILSLAVYRRTLKRLGIDL